MTPFTKDPDCKSNVRDEGLPNAPNAKIEALRSFSSISELSGSDFELIEISHLSIILGGSLPTTELNEHCAQRGLWLGFTVSLTLKSTVRNLRMTKRRSARQPPPRPGNLSQHHRQSLSPFHNAAMPSQSQHRAVTRWTARIVPLFILCAFGYAVYAIVPYLCGSPQPLPPDVAAID